MSKVQPEKASQVAPPEPSPVKSSQAGAVKAATHHSMREKFSEMVHQIHLSPGHKLLTDEKVLKSSLAALRFAIFADAICAQILQPNFAIMIQPGAHEDSFPDTDPFDLTAAQYFLPGVAGVATAFASLGFGALSDRVGRRPCMLVCLWAGAAGSALKYVLRGTFWGFCGANFVNGCFGASSVVAMAYVQDVYPHDAKKKEEEMGGIMGICACGVAVDAVVVAPLFVAPF